MSAPATQKADVISKNQSDNTRKIKRVIFVTGGKGGVGKSTVARAIYDLLRTNRVMVLAFDGDRDNSQLYRYYKDVGGGVTRIALNERGAADPLLNAMDQDKPDVILVDVAAGGGQSLQALEADLRILSDAAEMGYKFTIVSVISRIKDSINLLKQTLAITEAFDVDHIVFKNLYFGDAQKFRLFDGSKAENALLKAGGIVLELPELYDETYEVLDQRNLPFTLAREERSGLPRSHRSRVHQWLDLFEAQAVIAGERLGL